jgi:hypothetical protein
MIKYEVVIDSNGAEAWYKDNKLHRENDLPAVIHSSGTKVWYKEGQRHRENNLPAVVYFDGYEEYWLNDKQISKEEVMKKKYSIEDIKNMTIQELLDKINK